jgi:hypothetical protein
MSDSICGEGIEHEIVEYARGEASCRSCGSTIDIA